MGGETPGAFELLVLLALAGFDGEATGREVYDAVTDVMARDVSVAAIHVTLNRLSEKGWAEVRTSAPAPHEGGKPRKHYALSEHGATVLARQRAEHDALWTRAADHPLLDGEGR